MSEQPIIVELLSSADIVSVRAEGRTLALQLGFSPTEATLIATAISELARKINPFAKPTRIHLQPIDQNGTYGIAVMASDNGPAMQDIQQVMADRDPTAGGLRLRLSRVKRLMDDLDIVSEAGKGTTVTVKRWKR